MIEREAHGSERETERWLRRQGLPYFVKPRSRASRLTARVAPFLVFAFVYDLLSTFVVDINIDENSDAWEPGYVILAIVIILAGIAVPVVLALLSARLLRTRPAWKTPVSLIVIALFVVIDPIVLSLIGVDTFLGNALQSLIIVALAYLFTWLGIGSLLSWAIVSAFRQLSALGQLATRALPLLMLVVVFAFFARALWEVTSTMSVTRLTWVAVFFVVLGLLFAIPIMRGEMRGLDERIEPDERERLLADTALHELRARRTAAGPPLSRLERFNLDTVMVLAQGFQVLIFAVLVCVFLVVLGSLAFSPAVLTNWLGEQQNTVPLLGIDIPVHVALIKTAIFLSCVSSLNFLVSVSTGTAYRAAFYEPLLREARVALTVRAAYLAQDALAQDALAQDALTQDARSPEDGAP
jgi:hypothetical protein